jgi:proline iminopeptidase
MALFPYLDANRQFYLPVGEGHQLYVEESGNPQGRPVVVLHGGPGGGCSPALRRFFDPQKFRIILFDQRGSGQSRPLGSIDNNTLSHLLLDLEKIRQALHIERWMVFGGSWGATLALAYLAAFPQYITAMVLRGIFLCRERDLDWLYTSKGAARLFPEAWQALEQQAPPGSGHLLERYYQGLQGDDAHRYARAWCNWESTLALMPTQPPGAGSDGELCMARQETHYFLAGGFIERPLLEVCAGSQVPVEIVHGRRDFVCPPEQALALHQVLPNSELNWVDRGGHSSMDPGVAQALVNAVTRLDRRAKQ